MCFILPVHVELWINILTYVLSHVCYGAFINPQQSPGINPDIYCCGDKCYQRGQWKRGSKQLKTQRRQIWIKKTNAGTWNGCRLADFLNCLTIRNPKMMIFSVYSLSVKLPRFSFFTCFSRKVSSLFFFSGSWSPRQQHHEGRFRHHFFKELFKKMTTPWKEAA